ncbi:MAG: hypothetical protein ACOYYS_19655 [Chloroflexota bacterium]
MSYPVPTYRIRAVMRYGSTLWAYTSWYSINNASNYIEFDWYAVNDKRSLSLWLNGTQVQTLSGFPSLYTIEFVRLGAISVSGTSITAQRFYSFDAFESRRTTYIGPAAGQ